MCTKWGLSPFMKQCIITLGVALNNLVNGCSLAYPAVLLPQLRSPSSAFKLDREQESWIASINMVSSIFSGLLAVPAMRRGRKLTHYIISLLSITGWITTTLAENYEVLMFGRFLQGIAQGFFMPVFGVIIGEYTSPAYRGMFLAAVSLAQAIGVFFIHFVGSFLAWQDSALLISCFPVISFAITVFMPESPSWLSLEERFQDCRKAFRWLRGLKEEDELEKMIQARMHFETKDQSCRDNLRAFRKREFYIPLLLGVSMFLILCFCGSVILAAYMDVVVTVLIGKDCNMAAWMGILDGVRLVTNIIALYVVRRMPRRTILFWSGSACVFLYFAQAAYIYAKTKGLIDKLWLSALLFTSHVAVIGFGMVTLPYIIVGEVFPLQYRGLCGFLSSLSLAVNAFVLTKSFLWLVSSIGLSGAWMVYGGLVGLALMVAWKFLPETRGRTLQDIEEHFRGKLVADDEEAKEALSVTNGKVLP